MSEHRKQREKTSGRRERQVVSSFICQPANSPDGFNVLIFKRSDKVHTYKNKWGACSGGIDPTDPSPLAAAWREIQEETGLTEKELSYQRTGKPFTIVDESINTQWTIHPFSFLLKEGAKPVVIDWEHTDSRYVPPEEVKTYDTVPHLPTSLSRVLVGKNIAAGLQALQEDHENGARVLATKGVETLLEALQGDDFTHSDSAESLWRSLRLAGWHIAKNGRPSMGAAINYAVLAALASVKKTHVSNQTLNVSDFRTRAIESLKYVIEERQRSADKIVKAFKDYLDNKFGERPVTIVTVSSSSTIRNCVKAALLEKPSRQIDLKIMESRPNFEGVSFASSLLSDLQKCGEQFTKNLHVEVGTDVSAALMAKDADIVLIGADRISQHGDVSNKIGSLAAALLAKEARPDVEVVVLSEVEKIAGPGEIHEHGEENNDVSEVTEAWPLDEKAKSGFLREQNVAIKNIYFEWVPAKYVTSYVCETGVLAPADIRAQSKKVAEMEDEIFAKL
ncbi:nagb/rpia/CoA transferase-like protein [Xylona heveae TC161]|uniref:Nagb/rpia/CoA transferase-like protein n=1 Tax=Xylona heveae (strain CBS 132557 / TC161) TaxID=1328760 RepID=A0A165AE25_XYLHT|nr:nagb/rpia/CoA transferase-like protein [Xylona heveae TC161]KZF20324.1 nagb/rpia/CoA transferase-like protein [Xylona heveae TC161]